MAAGPEIELKLELSVEDYLASPMEQGLFGGEGVDFYQMQARYTVEGQVGERSIRFETRGAAETFRGRVDAEPR